MKEQITVNGSTPARRINHTTSPDAATLDDIVLFVSETIGGWSESKQREAYDYIGMYVSDWFLDYDLTSAEIDYIVAEVRDAFTDLEITTKYYFVTNEMDADGIYGNIEPYCMTEEEVKYLSKEWEVNLFEKMHEATAEELAQFGTKELAEFRTWGWTDE